MSSNTFDPYYIWLGIPPEEQPATYYRLLDVKVFETDAEVIDIGYQRRMAYLKGIKTGDRLDHAERLKDELSDARRTLLNAEKKAKYDAQLRGRFAAAAAPPAAPPSAPAPLPAPGQLPLPTAAFTPPPQQQFTPPQFAAAAPQVAPLPGFAAPTGAKRVAPPKAKSRAPLIAGLVAISAVTVGGAYLLLSGGPKGEPPVGDLPKSIVRPTPPPAITPSGPSRVVTPPPTVALNNSGPNNTGLNNAAPLGPAAVPTGVSIVGDRAVAVDSKGYPPVEIPVPTLSYDGRSPLTVEYWLTVSGEAASGTPSFPIAGFRMRNRRRGDDAYLSARFVRPQGRSELKLTTQYWAAYDAENNVVPRNMTVGGSTADLKSTHHIAMVAQPSTEAPGQITVRVFVDGELLWRHDLEFLPQVENEFFLDASGLGGVIDELRVSTVARYGPQFNPTSRFKPAARFEPDADTALLLHCDETSGTTLADAGSQRRNIELVAASMTRVPAPPKLGAAPYSGPGVSAAAMASVAPSPNVGPASSPPAGATGSATRPAVPSGSGRFEIRTDASKPRNSPMVSGISYDGRSPLTLETWYTFPAEAIDQKAMGFACGLYGHVDEPRATVPYLMFQMTKEAGENFFRLGGVFYKPKDKAPLSGTAFAPNGPDGARPALSGRHHLAVVVAPAVAGDKLELRVFLDGKRIGTTTSEQFAQLPLQLLIGSGTIDGAFDEQRLSKTARYKDDFTPQNRFEPDADTIALYHFDEGFGTELLDSSGNGRHATITDRYRWVPESTSPTTATNPTTGATTGAAAAPSTAPTTSSPSSSSPAPSPSPSPPVAPAGNRFALRIDTSKAGAEFASLKGIPYDGRSPFTLETWYTFPADAVGRKNSGFIGGLFGWIEELRAEIPELAFYLSKEAGEPHLRLVNAVYKPKDSAPPSGRMLFPSDQKKVQLSGRHHLALTVQPVADGKIELKLFVDGKRISSALSEPLAEVPMSFVIGSSNIDGIFDEQRLSKTARYSDDFTPKDRFETDADTIALYHFDEGSGTRLLDSSGNGHHIPLKPRFSWVREPISSSPTTTPTPTPPTNATPGGGASTTQPPGLAQPPGLGAVARPQPANPTGLAARVDTSLPKKNYLLVKDVPYDGRSPLTLETWYTFAGDSVDRAGGGFACALFGKLPNHDNYVPYLTFFLRKDANQPQVRVMSAWYKPKTQETQFSTQIFPTGREQVFLSGRHHLAITVQPIAGDKLDIAFYIDGKRHGSAVSEHLHELPMALLVAGADLDGVYDEQRLSKTVRYTSDFTPRDRFETDADTLALYRFEEGKGTQYLDSSGHGRHATLESRYGWTSEPGAGAAPAKSSTSSSSASSSSGATSGTTAPATATAPAAAGRFAIRVDSSKYPVQVSSTDKLSYDGRSPLTVETWYTRQPGPIKRDLPASAFGFKMGPDPYLSLWLGNDDAAQTVRVSQLGYRSSAAPQQALIALNPPSTASTLTGRHHLAFTVEPTDVDKCRLRIFIDGKRSGDVLTRELYQLPTSLFIGGLRVEGAFDEYRISKSIRYLVDFTPQERFEPDADTLALYHFDEGRGTQFLDSSGNGRHLPVTPNYEWVDESGAKVAAVAPAAAWTPGRYALDIDPTTDPRRQSYVEGVPYDGRSPLTIELTLEHPDRLAAREFFITTILGFGHRSDKSEDRVNYLNLQIQKRVGDSTYFIDGIQFTRGSTSLPARIVLPKRCRLALTAEASTKEKDRLELRIFVDGKLKNTSTIPFPTAGVKTDLFLGGSYYFDGIIDELRVSKTVRYRDDYVPADRFITDNDTVALYHFDDAPGTRLFDSSGQGYHGLRRDHMRWVPEPAATSADSSTAKP